MGALARIFQGIFLCLLFLMANPSVYGRQTNVAVGFVDYQFEGAGPGGNLWESKPKYPNEPYLEIELTTRKPYEVLREIESPVFYKKINFEFLGGRWAREHQDAERKVETGIASVAAAWSLPNGLGFEMGPIILWQQHRIRDLADTATVAPGAFKVGSYFGFSYRAHMGDWEGEFGSMVGVLGWPHRQSAVSAMTVLATRRLGTGPWRAGLRGKLGLIQISRDGNVRQDIGSASGIVTQFKQGETDTKILTLILGREF